jgi:putative ABC transport system permease protein
VASLALASAMAIMVNSFRASVDQWLTTVLPAEMYLRKKATAQKMPAEIIEAIKKIPGISNVEAVRAIELSLVEQLAPVTLLAKDFDLVDLQKSLPLTGETPSPAFIQKIQASGHIPIFVSEAMQDLYGWSLGQVLSLPSLDARFQIAGIWRDYVRQSGSIVMQRSAYQKLTNDPWIDDALISLSSDPSSDTSKAASMASISEHIRAFFPGEDMMIRSTLEIRTLSLAMFDRSFALTYVLEAVAVLGALFGVASTYSGEALARAREFGMLRHLGITRGQINKIFAIETSIMLLFSVAWALILSLGLAWILIHRINPQSFHWTMDTKIPTGMMLLSGVIVLVLGVVTAWLATRAATSHGPVLAVREDW